MNLAAAAGQGRADHSSGAVPIRGALMALLSVVLLLAWSSCRGVTPALEQPNARTSIQQLLVRFAAALRTGNQDQLRALIVPDEPQFLQEQLRLQHNLAGLQTDRLEYRLTGSVPANPIASQQQWRLDGVVQYAVAGIDQVAVQRPLTLGVVRTDSSWLLFDATPAAVPWQFGPLTEKRVASDGRAVVIVGHPGSAVPVRLAAEIDSALLSLKQFWGSDWRAGLMMVATASSEEFNSLVGVGRMDGVAAATVADGVNDGTAVGQRVLFASGVANLRPDQFRVVLRHELFHAATRAVTSDGAPLWIVEGMADYNGRRGGATSWQNAAPTLAAAVADGQVPDRLPTDIDLAVPGMHQARAYEEAWSVMQCIADIYGEDKLKQLYRQGAELGLKPQAEAIQQALGVDQQTLVRQWQRWLRSRPLG